MSPAGDETGSSPSGRGRLIAFEGNEGAGKSTQARRLADELGAELTREPGGTALGERVRELLLFDRSRRPLDARAELLLMLAQRAQHVAEQIGPSLRRGRHVVVDRFTGSSIAYQGYGRELPLEQVRALCELAVQGCTPDLNVLIDVPIGVGASRRPRHQDRFEREGREFHERVRRGYLELAAQDPAHWVVIDGTRTVEAVASDVTTAVLERLSILPVSG